MQLRASSFGLNRSTRLSDIKIGSAGAIGMEGSAPKIEGEESEERVFHSEKGFVFVVNIVVQSWREEENVSCMASLMRTWLKYFPTTRGTLTESSV